MSAFGKRLQEACDAIGLTPTRLTTVLKMPKGYISELQRKDGSAISTYPRWAFNLVAILGVRWEWLFYDEEPMYPPSGPSTPQAAGAMIAIVNFAASHPKKQANSIAVERATKEIAATGFTSGEAWDWSEVIRLHLLAEEGAKGMVDFRKRVEKKNTLEGDVKRRRIRVAAEKKRDRARADLAAATPTESAEIAPRRMKRTKTR